jgi:protein involved in polysaccharide export with SLBB domain
MGCSRFVFEPRARWIWFLTLILIACACASSAAKPMTLGPPPKTDASLGPGDTFEVSVYGESDLSGKYRIAEDGTINFPLVGRVQVAGKAPGQIATLIQETLLEKQILRAPHVSVFLMEQTSKQISVMGAVAKPGSFTLAAGMTVIQAIGVAGGLSQLASSNNTIITRHVNGQLQRFKVAIERISEGREEDVKLQAGDIVYVPERVF